MLEINIREISRTDFAIYVLETNIRVTSRTGFADGFISFFVDMNLSYLKHKKPATVTIGCEETCM